VGRGGGRGGGRVAGRVAFCMRGWWVCVGCGCTRCAWRVGCARCGGVCAAWFASRGARKWCA